MIFVILALLGLCLGSFTNALVWRIHEQSKAKNPSKKLSILHGRSMCPNCKHVLSVGDLLPAVSWLALRGKCRYCHKPISWQYPLVELSMAGLFLASYLWWPYGFNTVGWVRFGIWLIFLIGLMALLVYDLRWMLLPNRIIYPLLVLAGVQVLVLLIAGQGVSPLVRAFWGVLCLSGTFYVLFQVSAGKWIGGGDVKLGAVIGLLVGGPLAAFVVLFSASLLGSLLAIPGVILHKKTLTSRIPFGPFLIAGTFIAYIFGAAIISWYQHQFLLL